MLDFCYILHQSYFPRIEQTSHKLNQFSQIHFSHPSKSNHTLPRFRTSLIIFAFLLGFIPLEVCVPVQMILRWKEKRLFQQIHMWGLDS